MNPEKYTKKAFLEAEEKADEATELGSYQDSPLFKDDNTPVYLPEAQIIMNRSDALLFAAEAEKLRLETDRLVNLAYEEALQEHNEYVATEKKILMENEVTSTEIPNEIQESQAEAGNEAVKNTSESKVDPEVVNLESNQELTDQKETLPAPEFTIPDDIRTNATKLARITNPNPSEQDIIKMATRLMEGQVPESASFKEKTKDATESEAVSAESFERTKRLKRAVHEINDIVIKFTHELRKRDNEDMGMFMDQRHLDRLRKGLSILGEVELPRNTFNEEELSEGLSLILAGISNIDSVNNVRRRIIREDSFSLKKLENLVGSLENPLFSIKRNSPENMNPLPVIGKLIAASNSAAIYLSKKRRQAEQYHR